MARITRGDIEEARQIALWMKEKLEDRASEPFINLSAVGFCLIELGLEYDETNEGMGGFLMSIYEQYILANQRY